MAVSQLSTLGPKPPTGVPALVNDKGQIAFLLSTLSEIEVDMIPGE